MKVTNPLFTKALGLLGAWLIRGWTATLDYRIVYQDPTVDPVNPRCRPRALYVLWHEYLICPLGVRGRGMAVLISQHRDGELITQVLHHLGFKVVRGSSTRGGIAAVKKVLRSQESGGRTGVTPVLPPDGRKRHLIITPDGPRGPRRQLEEGAIYLAARLSLPIVCMGFAFDRPWRLNSWDQFAIPRPFSRARAVISPYLEIPSTLAKKRVALAASCQWHTQGPEMGGRTGVTPVLLFEHYRLQVEQVLTQVTQEAEHWARAGNRKSGEMPFLRNEVSATPAYAPAMTREP